ncbi:MAG: NAD(P)/FAD-dependent oxidoreductase [Bacilli bacterium]|jgi:NADH dehydrogenase|nr:NAD(P)/FAD-dependent oxidoreductase [Bacilli bacterium]
MKEIIVLGGGYAGVLTAKYLHKNLKKNKDVNITLIDKNPYHTMLTELHEVAGGRVDEESIKMDFSDIFAGRNVNVILDEIINIDFNNKIIYNKEKTNLRYDYLVIATGCKPTYFNTPGSEFVYNLWSYQDATNLNEQILHCFRSAACTKDGNERKKLLTFTVVGSGFTGVEMAGELGEYKNELCNKFDIDKNEVTINLVDVVDHILPNYPDKLVKKVEKRCAKLGITIKCGEAVSEVGNDFVTVGKTKIPCMTTIWAAGIEGSEMVDKIEDLKKEGRGRLATNKYLQAIDHKDVFVAGDNIYYIPEGEEKPVPQMVENAEKSAETVAHNIWASIIDGDFEEYNPKFNGSMVCVGSRYGVAALGSNPDKPIKLSGFLAMFIKHFVNLIYFFKVLGFNKCWSYLKHEIFMAKNRRSFVGGHFSNQDNAPTFFLVPLRIWVGFMWLASGVSKLPAWIKDWTNVTSMPNRTQYWALVGETPEAASSASQAVTSTDVTSAASTATTTTDAVTAATTATTSTTPSGSLFDQFGTWLKNMFEIKATNPMPRPRFIHDFMAWIFEHGVWGKGDTFTIFAALLNSGMMFAEIGVGLLLIVGLLTPLAAIGGFVMMIIIYFSGWAYSSIFFYGFASLACIFAGNAFGLDYYFKPILDKVLTKFSLTRKLYLYFRKEK